MTKLEAVIKVLEYVVDNNLKPYSVIEQTKGMEIAGDYWTGTFDYLCSGKFAKSNYGDLEIRNPALAIAMLAECREELAKRNREESRLTWTDRRSWIAIVISLLALTFEIVKLFL